MLLLNRKLVSRTLLFLILGLIAASFGTDILKYGFGLDYLRGLRPLFSLGNEKNIPTWYSMCALLSASLLLLLIARLEAQRNDPQRHYWLILSIIFLFLAYDEAFSVHENMSSFGQQFVGNEGIFYFAWIAPASLMVLVVGLFFLRFLLSLEYETKRQFIIAGVVYVGGAIGFEAVSGQYLSVSSDNFGYAIIDTIEEAMEMFGVYIFILALLRYLEIAFKSVTITFSAPLRNSEGPDGPSL